MQDITSPYGNFTYWALGLSVVLPLLSFLISLLISDRYAWSVSLLAPFLLLVSTICSFAVTLEVWGQPAFEVSTLWFTSGRNAFSAGIFLNDMAALMLAVVSLISFLVHIYSIGYMAGDSAEKRYFGMLGLFTFSMLGIVLSDNLLLIFVFWELVGFSSYMLIGHWREKPEAAVAANKAFIINRIGDAGFLVGLMILWSTGNGFELAGFETLPSSAMNTAAGLCLFCGVIGKSAQFPLSTWLPDAMEGPTPVSALIHAATMVAAGVFLMARIFVLFTPEALFVVAVIGIVTALMAALAALFQTDIKKILAYSTISQLGLMVTAVGAGSWEAAFLHLITHAFFKACLFLCAGSVIHVLHQAQHQSHLHFDVQDIRNLGGLRKKLPFTFLAVLISGSALAGIPFFSGFISKEAIFITLHHWKGDEFNARWMIFFLAFAVSFLTVMYITRFTVRIFFGKEGATSHLTLNEPPKIMRAPIGLLTLLSLWLAVSTNPFGGESYFIGSGAEHNTILTIFSAIWVLGALGVSWKIFSKPHELSSPVLRHSFYLDSIQNLLFVKPAIIFSNATMNIDRRLIDGAIHALAYAHVTVSHLAGWCDKTVIDGAVNGVASLSRLTGSLMRSFQGGKIQLYVFWAVFAIIIFLIWSLI